MLLQEIDVTEGQFIAISEMVYRHCGINLHDGKKELVRARIAKRLRVGGFASVSAYLEHVRQDGTGREFAELIDALSTNLTSFFREQNHFTYLAEKFVPEMLKRKSRPGRSGHPGEGRIRAWSAGCSSGEEPYSLAMTLLEALALSSTSSGQAAPGCAPGSTPGYAPASTPGWDVKLLATDISHPVLERAIRGVYPKDRVASVPPALRGRYFAAQRDGSQTQLSVVPRVRELVCFNYLNLMEAWPFDGPFDFIFCRNVMIYFDKPTQQRLINRFWDVLEPGGLLFTGHSESLTGVAHRFAYVEPTIYAKAL
jgi:chemotaxis protein methyltransferase CheR